MCNHTIIYVTWSKVSLRLSARRGQGSIWLVQTWPQHSTRHRESPARHRFAVTRRAPRWMPAAQHGVGQARKTALQWL